MFDFGFWKRKLLQRRENKRRCSTWKLITGLMISLNVSYWLTKHPRAAREMGSVSEIERETTRRFIVVKTTR